MSETFFRKQDLIIKDRVISLEQKSIEDIFRFNQQPYIIVGVSGCGKTTLCIDIMYKFSKKCTNIYYITSTKESIRDDSISQIPKAFRRRPTFDNIYNIWREIIAAHDAAEANESKLTRILVQLTSQTEAQHIMHALGEKQQQIQNEQYKIYTSSGENNNTAMEKSKHDSKAFYIDTLSKLILDFAKTKGTAKLTSDDMSILNSLVSIYPRTLLLMDDVSAELNDLKTSTKKVVYNGSLSKISEAYKNVIMDILTRGRHYGALICLFLHTIDLIQDKSLINNLVILNKEAAKKVGNARSFPDEMRSILDAATPVLFNNKDYEYYFLYLSQLDGDIAVGKADLHYGQTLPLSKLNKEFAAVVDNIYAGVDATYVNNNNNADDGYESEYYSDDNGFTLDKQ